MPSADRKMHEGQVRKPEQDAGLAPRLHRMEGRSGIPGFGGRERKGSREGGEAPPHPQPEGQNEHLENELEQDLPLLGPEA